MIDFTIFLNSGHIFYVSKKKKKNWRQIQQILKRRRKSALK